MFSFTILDSVRKVHRTQLRLCLLSDQSLVKRTHTYTQSHIHNTHITSSDVQLYLISGSVGVTHCSEKAPPSCHRNQSETLPTAPVRKGGDSSIRERT